MESYEELRRQRDYYKYVADRHNELIDSAKFWIGFVIVMLIVALDIDKILELF